MIGFFPFFLLLVCVTILDFRMIKFFDVICFDMSNMIALNYVPDSAVWISQRSGASRGLYSRVAVADLNSPLIRIYLADGIQSEALLHEVSLHTQPVR